MATNHLPVSLLHLDMGTMELWRQALKRYVRLAQLVDVLGSAQGVRAASGGRFIVFA